MLIRPKHIDSTLLFAYMTYSLVLPSRTSNLYAESTTWKMALQSQRSYSSEDSDYTASLRFTHQHRAQNKHGTDGCVRTNTANGKNWGGSQPFPWQQQRAQPDTQGQKWKSSAASGWNSKLCSNTVLPSWWMFNTQQSRRISNIEACHAFWVVTEQDICNVWMTIRSWNEIWTTWNFRKQNR